MWNMACKVALESLLTKDGYHRDDVGNFNEKGSLWHTRAKEALEEWAQEAKREVRLKAKGPAVRGGESCSSREGGCIVRSCGAFPY